MYLTSKSLGHWQELGFILHLKSITGKGMFLHTFNKVKNTTLAIELGVRSKLEGF